MQLIIQRLTILFVIFGSSFGRPNLEAGKEDASTTPESIESIFRKYDQQYPYHGGANNEDADLQNDEPVMEAIIERLNEIINDDKPNDFKAPLSDASVKQRSLLRKQNEELVFGSVHLNRRIEKEPLNRANPEKSETLDQINQNVFLNKDLLADSYNTRPAAVRVPVRIPIPMPTRFVTRRRTTPTPTATPAVFHDTAAGDKIKELVAEELLKKPEGNKLSIPVLSVATEDFEEDVPVKQIVTKKPNKISAQTDDFEERHGFRTRRESGSYDWLNRMALWFSFYDETDAEMDAGEGRKMSALNKRETLPNELTQNDTEILSEPVPVPEQVKSVDVPPQVSDAVIETILDIDDPQTRNEFAKDVPAIEEKLGELEEQAEANQTTVEVAIVELGQTEPEKLGTVVEDIAIVLTKDALAVAEDPVKVIEETKAEVLDPVEEVPVSGRSVDVSSKEIVPEAATIEVAIESKTTTVAPEITSLPEIRNEEVQAIVEEGRLLPVAEMPVEQPLNGVTAAPIEVVADEKRSEIEITSPSTAAPTVATLIEVLPTITQDTLITAAASPDTIINEPIVPSGLSGLSEANQQNKDQIVTEGTPSELTVNQDADEGTEEDIPLDAILPEIVITETNPEEIEKIINSVDEVETPSSTSTPTLMDNNGDDPRIVIEPEVEEEPMPRLLSPSEDKQPIDDASGTTSSLIRIPLTKIEHPTFEEVVLLTGNENTDPKPVVDENSVPVVIAEEEVAGIEVKRPQEALITEINQNHSGSDSQSISTTESTSEVETPASPLGSSEEQDGSNEDDAEKIKRKEEKRRLKEERERLKEEKKEWKKANKISSSEEEGHINLTQGFKEPVVEERLTKEQMVNIFSSPEKDVEGEVRRLEPVTEIRTTDPVLVISEVLETQKNVLMDHVVIKKDGVAEIDDVNDNSVESGEDATTTAPELMAKLDAALQKEIVSVAEVLQEIQENIDNELRREAAETTEPTTVVTDAASIEAEAELTNSVISSKNTRSYNGADYVEKDVFPDGAEARQGTDFSDGETESASVDSRTFVLVGSCLFLVIGFILFSLVVLLIKRSGRHGSLDLTIEP